MPAGRVSRPAESERERADLESERDFLLRSLDDLELERASGSIEPESYETLHDDYTARAAAVIRALRDGVDARPTRAPVSWQRRALVFGGVAAFAALVAVGLAAALGARLPGQTASGNAGPAVVAPRNDESRREKLERAITENPDDIGSRLLLAPILEADGDLVGALRRYDEIIAIDEANAKAHAQAGRIIYLTAGRATTDEAAALAVRDHGSGLHPGETTLVFNRFWRGDPARARRGGGTGLGLAIALEDAQLHGGWLQAWGEPDRGSQFRLTIPRRAGDDLRRSPIPLVPDDLAIGTAESDASASTRGTNRTPAPLSAQPEPSAEPSGEPTREKTP